MTVKAVVPEQRSLLTVEEWVSHPDADQYELIDGILRARMVNQNYHEFAVVRAGYVLTDHLLKSRISGQVFGSNVKYRVRARRGIMPDLSVILGEKVARIVPDAAFNTEGLDLAVEVLSTEQGPDYIEERLDDYQKLGTTEVWIVDPRTRVVTGFTRESGVYEQCETASDNEVFCSRLLAGLNFSVGLLWM